MAQRLTQSSVASAFERERLEVDRGFFPELDEGEAEVRIPVQVRFVDLVKDRHTAIVIAPFEKRPDERRRAIRRTDRIAEGHPRAPLHPVHDEPAPLVIEQDGFVAEEYQVPVDGRMSGDNRAGIVEIGRRWRLHFMRCRGEQARHREQQQHDRGSNRGAKKP